MKQMIKNLCCLGLLFTLSFALVGCRNDSSNDNADNRDNDTTNGVDSTTPNDPVTGENTGLSKVDDQLKNKYGSDYEVTNKDVSEAVTYIHENISNIKDRSVAKNLYEKGSYLEMVADIGNVSADDSIRRLGEKTKEYAKKVYEAKDDEVSDIIDNGKSDFEDFKTEFNDGVDNAVNKFMNFFK